MPAGAERVVRELYETFNREGLSAVADRYWHPDIEYEDDPAFPGAGAHYGREAAEARFAEVIDALGITEVTVEEFVDTGSESAWIIRVVGSGSQGAGVPTEHLWGYSGRVVDGRLVYFRAYYDAPAAIEAVGADK